MRKAITHLRSADPILGQIISRVGPCSIQYNKPDFETLVRSIIYQQLNGKAAASIYQKFRLATGRITPRNILTLEEGVMRASGLSSQKSKYILDLAEKTYSKVIRFRQIETLTDPEVILHLTQVKGVGVWTAQMFLIFALQRQDVLPTGDLGIRIAMKRSYQLEELPKPAEMEKIAAPWKPWSSIACWYLWRSLDGPAGM